MIKAQKSSKEGSTPPHSFNSFRGSKHAWDTKTYFTVMFTPPFETRDAKLGLQVWARRTS